MQVVPDAYRVAICCPTGEEVKTAFAVSLVEMMQHTLMMQDGRLEACKLNCMATSMLPWSRHELTRVSLEQGATHLLWIDSDMSFPRDMLLRFLAHGQPIVGINAMARRPPYNCTAQREDGSYAVTTANSTGLEKVGRTGFGVLWIAAQIYREIPLPWYTFEWLPERGCYRGEDYGLLEAAKRAGHEVMIDHDLSKQVGHIGGFTYHPLLKDGGQA